MATSARVNPYPSESTLLFWHDLWKQQVEENNADWRECSAWVNENIANFRAGNSQRLQRPWLAIRAAYEAQRKELEELKALCGPSVSRSVRLTKGENDYKQHRKRRITARNKTAAHAVNDTALQSTRRGRA